MKVLLQLLALWIFQGVAGQAQPTCPTQLCVPLEVYLKQPAFTQFYSFLDIAGIPIADLDKLGTLFVPTNQAFYNFAGKFNLYLTQLKQADPKLIKAVLLFHVAPGQYRPNPALEIAAQVMPTALATNNVDFTGICAGENGKKDVFLNAFIKSEGITVTGGSVKAKVLYNSPQLCNGVQVRTINEVLNPCIPSQAQPPAVTPPPLSPSPALIP